ncbi:MAG: hypothetical protein R2714_07345 [Microthrixaceae bacterium]
MLGHTYKVQPVPPDPDHTVYFDAGVLRIGVEYRVVTPEALAATYEGEALAEVEDNSPEGGFSDQGLSIHIDSVLDDHEYLRFDAFDDDPHYHYVDRAEGTNTVVGFDTAAHGPVVPWVLHQVRHRLDPMLRRAGAAHVADSLEADSGTRIAAILEDYLPTLGIDTAGTVPGNDTVPGDDTVPTEDEVTS